MFVNQAPRPAADRFALIMDGLCRAIAARGGRRLIPGPIVIVLWTRLRRMAARLVSLAARLRSNTLRPPKPACPRVPLASAPSPRRPRSTASNRWPFPIPRLPRSFGWLVRLAPEAACYRSQLCHLLSDPEMAALLSAAPQTQRVLRPLCHMLAIRWEGTSRSPPPANAASPNRPRAAGHTWANPPPEPPRDPPTQPQRAHLAPA
jgi:hypothetical protein